jgi:hypothetical protein
MTECPHRHLAALRIGPGIDSCRWSDIDLSSDLAIDLAIDSLQVGQLFTH